MTLLPRTPLAQRLPEFPWDSLADVSASAHAHPDGIVDLSIGTPVDEIAPGIQLALSQAAAAPGYPPTTGTPQLHDAIATWLNRRYGTNVTAAEAMAVVGTKEAIALLPTLLGIRDCPIVIPEIAYPTYEVAARLAGNTPVRGEALVEGAPLIFLNSPANPTGRVLGVQELRTIVADARARGAIVASDECYIGLGWADDKQPVSILDERVCEGDHTGLLAIHSLSKSSNMASYRAGMIIGDAALIAELTGARKHLGLMVPGPIQAAMLEALADDGQEQLQKLRYARRRAVLLPALLRAGFTIEHSEAGLYLWASRGGEQGRDTVAWLAERGILVAPGEFYGPTAAHHVRVSLTASDERIAAAAARLA